MNDDTREADYAVQRLRSLHVAEVQGAEAWLLSHPDQAETALIAALHTPAAQPAAVLLGRIGRPTSIGPLVAAHHRGGEGLRAAVERGLALHGSADAEAALATLRRQDDAGGAGEGREGTTGDPQ